jgi:glycosyltransferase involved in cell wall biosynthesis
MNDVFTLSKKWLLCLFTYNRPNLLLNAVNSIERYFPCENKLLIDDGSDNPNAISVIKRISELRGWQLKIQEKQYSRSFGGLYPNMNYALTYALDNGFDYAFFVQDDHQFLWCDEQLESHVHRIFTACTDAIQIQALFFRRILNYRQSMEYIDSVQAYRVNRGFDDVGIWNLNEVRKQPGYKIIDEYGGSCTAVNSTYWLKKGYRIYQLFSPIKAVIPWVETRSTVDTPSSYAVNSQIAQNDNLQLRPLSAKEIDWLKNRPAELPAYQEYFKLSHDNYRAPIWHQAGHNLHRYYYLCRQLIDDENHLQQSPLPVTMVEDVGASQLPPLQSHLDWQPPGPNPNQSPWDGLPSFLQGLRKKVAKIKNFSLSDYLGYRELKRRLKKEQAKLAAYFGYEAD